MPGQSFLNRKGPSPHTHSVLSQKHKIYNATGGASQIIGVISSFNPTGNRNVEPVRGIGYGDVIAELVPNVSDPVTISVDRTALYTSFLMQTFGYFAMADGLVRSLATHRWPFDIKSEVVFSELGTANVVGGNTVGAACGMRAVVTLYGGCWMTSHNITYTVDGALVTETCDISVTEVTDNHGSPGECAQTGNAGGSVVFRG